MQQANPDAPTAIALDHRNLQQIARRIRLEDTIDRLDLHRAVISHDLVGNQANHPRCAGLAVQPQSLGAKVTKLYRFLDNMLPSCWQWRRGEWNLRPKWFRNRCQPQDHACRWRRRLWRTVWL